MESAILVSIRENIGIITLNRPQNLNSVDAGMLKEIAAQILIWEKAKEIKTIIITGGEKFFSSGIDIKELVNEANRVESNFSNMQDNFSIISHCKKPLIAVVSGYALGIGLEIALACDFILASDEAKFAHPELSLNFIPYFGGIQRLVRTIGKAKTMEMILTGRSLTADEAEICGLVSRIVPLADILDDAIKTAKKIANHSEETIKIARNIINSALVGIEEGIALEKSLGEICLANTDFKQALIGLQKK